MTFAIGYYCDKCGTLDWSCKEFCWDCGNKASRMIYEGPPHGIPFDKSNPVEYKEFFKDEDLMIDI